MKWKLGKFTDIVKDITGGNQKFQSTEYFNVGELPIIDQGNGLIAGYTNTNSKVKRNKSVVIFGDHTKCLKYVDFDFCLGADGVKVLQPIDGLETKFLYFFLSTIKLPDVGYSRHYKFLKDIEIPLPPLPIQQKIAAILDQADALRRKDKELLAKYDELLQAVFYDMFGDPVKNEKGWEVKKFCEVGSLDRGVSKNRPRNAPELLGGKYPLIQTGEVANSNGYIKHYKNTYSDVGLKQSKLWKSGTMCITIAANIAKTGILTFDACFPDSIVGFIPNSNTNVEYIQWWLSHLQEMLESTAPESAQKNINLDILRKIDVPIPPITLQNGFREIVKNIEQQKAQIIQQQTKSEHLFQSLMQQAFKGKLVG